MCFNSRMQDASHLRAVAAEMLALLEAGAAWDSDNVLREALNTLRRALKREGATEASLVGSINAANYSLVMRGRRRALSQMGIMRPGAGRAISILTYARMFSAGKFPPRRPGYSPPPGCGDRGGKMLKLPHSPRQKVAQRQPEREEPR